MTSRDLAEALAARLSDVAPEGLRIGADGGRVTVHRGDVLLGESSAPQILDGSDDVRQLETAARSTISAVQDVIAEELTTPWPMHSGAMPAPGARVDGDVLLAWFGPAEEPVVSLAPFRIDGR